VLLIGETGCGKTTLAELLAVVTKRKFFSINCHKHMEASDLLGSLRPCVNPNSKAKFEFVNGVVIEAMLEGGILLIDEINTAEDSVLERLNQVLESGEIGIERGEGWETINAKEGFCIIATMNPSGDYGKKELSPALRNRFT
jgi:midasin